MTASTLPTEIITRGIIKRDERTLLVRSSGSSWWFLPGGHLEAGESLIDCLRRELREEASLEIESPVGIGVVEHNYVENGSHHHEINVVIAAIAASDFGRIEPGLEFRWMADYEIAATEVRPPTILPFLVTRAHDTLDTTSVVLIDVVGRQRTRS